MGLPTLFTPPTGRLPAGCGVVAWPGHPRAWPRARNAPRRLQVHAAHRRPSAPSPRPRRTVHARSGIGSSPHGNVEHRRAPRRVARRGRRDPPARGPPAVEGEGQAPRVGTPAPTLCVALCPCGASRAKFPLRKGGKGIARYGALILPRELLKQSTREPVRREGYQASIHAASDSSGEWPRSTGRPVLTINAIDSRRRPVCLLCPSK